MKDIVMVHGANCGGWCFDEFREVFEARGLTCQPPDLIDHGTDKGNGQDFLANWGMVDYRAQVDAFVRGLPARPQPLSIRTRCAVRFFACQGQMTTLVILMTLSYP